MLKSQINGLVDGGMTYSYDVECLLVSIGHPYLLILIIETIKWQSLFLGILNDNPPNVSNEDKF
jgi:hypothetical protein